MKLIDINALAKKHCLRRDEFTCEKCIEDDAQYNPDGIGKCCLEFRGEYIQDAPTIYAIPVEWLREFDLYYSGISGGSPYMNELLKAWQEEQEANNEADKS